MVMAMLVAPNLSVSGEKLAAAYTWLMRARRSLSLSAILALAVPPAEVTLLERRVSWMSPRALVMVAFAKMVALTGAALYAGTPVSRDTVKGPT